MSVCQWNYDYYRYEFFLSGSFEEKVDYMDDKHVKTDKNVVLFLDELQFKFLQW